MAPRAYDWLGEAVPAKPILVLFWYSYLKYVVVKINENSLFFSMRRVCEVQLARFLLRNVLGVPGTVEL